MVGRLIERYDGTVELAEAGPHGSTFAVELPYASTDVDSPWVERTLSP